MAEAELPLVSVIMPVRDEAEHLDASLGSVLAQDWPADRLEVLVVDGRSTDGTSARAAAIAEEVGHEVLVLDNPAGTVPVAMNLGLARARGSVIVRVDGHCAVPPHYLRRCVQLLDETGADAVGGILDTVGETVAARAIAAAQSHRLGVGPVAFRTGAATGGPVDTLAFGAYRRDVFDRIGGFDEELVRNQDDELNLRLTEAGGVIWLDPSLRSTYRSRGTFAGLWRQYEGYGSWKVRVAQKHGKVASWRHLVPAGFVAGLAGAGGLALTGRRRPLAAALVAYGGALAVAAARADEPSEVQVRMPIGFATLHVAYGVGTWRGIWRWRAGFRDRPRPVGPAAPATEVVEGGAAAAERAAVDARYRSYAASRSSRWTRSNPGNRAMLAERDQVLLDAIDDHPAGRIGVRVLEVGSGSGDVLGSLLDAGLPAGHLVGVDVRAEAVEQAREAWPAITFRTTSPDVLDAPDGSVDVAIAFTVFSSVQDRAVAQRLAAELERVLAPGGVLAWYDLRVPSPGNPSVHPHRPAEVRALLPGLEGELQPITLLPPLARRLGPLTDPVYRLLAVGPLRTHLVGMLRRPG